LEQNYYSTVCPVSEVREYPVGDSNGADAVAPPSNSSRPPRPISITLVPTSSVEPAFPTGINGKIPEAAVDSTNQDSSFVAEEASGDAPKAQTCANDSDSSMAD
jgi:hypothetical protein